MSLIPPSMNMVARPETLSLGTMLLSRSTSAYRRNAVGVLESKPANTLRHDYDPATGAYLGVLLESASTNYALYSEQVNVTWAQNSISVTADNTTAPDNTATADRVADIAASGAHHFRQTTTLTANAQVTASCFVKAGTGRYVYITLVDSVTTGNNSRVFFDLQAGTLCYTSNNGLGSVPTGTIEAYPNGWYRISITGTPTTAAVSLRVDFGVSSNGVNGITNYTGTGLTWYFWGMMVEPGYLSSYIQTTSATVTRTADLMSSSLAWLNSNTKEGTLYVEFQPRNTLDTVARPVLQMDDGSSSNRRTLTFVSNSSDNMVFDASETVSGSATADSSVTMTASLSKVQVAYAFATGNFRSALNGTLGTLVSSGAMPTVTTFRVGSDYTGACLNGWVRHVTYFPRRLSDNDVGALSTL